MVGNVGILEDTSEDRLQSDETHAKEVGTIILIKTHLGITKIMINETIVKTGATTLIPAMSEAGQLTVRGNQDSRIVIYQKLTLFTLGKS